MTDQSHRIGTDIITNYKDCELVLAQYLQYCIQYHSDNERERALSLELTDFEMLRCLHA